MSLGRSRLAAAIFALLAPPIAHALDAGDAAPSIPAAQSGRVVYVDFWASWCVPCRKSMPALEALYRKHGAAGFAVVGVNKDVNDDDSRRFLERVPVTFTLVKDADDRIARSFRVKAMPSGYLVDRRGIVRRVHRGFTDATAAELDEEIQSLLREPR
jgi:cytochrome c biogenesis protein CcmG, thiol:disulfide interchange protein DsbE